MVKLLNLILIFFLVLSLVYSSSAYAAGNAKLSLSPASANKTLGSSFDIEIRLNSGGEKINSVASFLSFPKDLVDVQISTLNSFANFFSQREVDSSTGTVKINGGVSDGATGDNLLVATLTLTPKNTGSANLSFTSQSVVYKGTTNVLGSSSGGVYTLTRSGSFSGATNSATPSSSATSSAFTTPIASSSSASSLPNSGIPEFSFFLGLLSIGAITLGITLKKLLS